MSVNKVILCEKPKLIRFIAIVNNLLLKISPTIINNGLKKIPAKIPKAGFISPSSSCDGIIKPNDTIGAATIASITNIIQPIAVMVNII